MKKSILMFFAVSLMVACNKKEATASLDQSADQSDMSAKNDSATMSGDSAMVSKNADSATSLNDQDKIFADGAAIGGMMEVMSGQLAANNATDKAVKKLGEIMVKDHGKANEELKQWASEKGYTLPAKLDAAQQKKYDDLKVKKGTEFDRMYTDLMVADHQKTIADFKKEASEGSESALKAFASKTLPTLEHHLMESENVKSALK
jgi:putative membrane protein